MSDFVGDRSEVLLALVHRAVNAFSSNAAEPDTASIAELTHADAERSVD